MTHSLRHRLTLFAVLVPLFSLGGPLYWVLFMGPGHEVTPQMTYAQGLIGGSVLLGFYLLVVPGRYGEPLRRAPFLVRFAVFAVAVSLSILIAGFLSVWVALGTFYPLAGTEPGWTLYAFVAGVAFVLMLGTQITRMIGSRVLANVMLGRYHTPRHEDRVFLFVDLEGSTTLAQKLGDIGVQRLLTRFFFDISEPIARHGGEIHAYVGDEAIITWPLRRALRDAACIRCLFAIEQTIAERADAYRATFGVVPQFRAGLHGGPVVVSECGDAKRAIVYFGDTINTAARLEQHAKDADRRFLVSAWLLEQLALPPMIRAEMLGEVTLRGQVTATAVCALVRDADGTT